LILSAYIHIPFCAHKCDFCDFAAFASVGHLEDAYCAIVCDEINKRIDQLEEKPTLTSVFYGGGTPGLIQPANIRRIQETLTKRVHLIDCAEITLETTPSAVTLDKAVDWLAIGVNRLSIGIESLIDSELKAIGRHGSVGEAIACLSAASSAGFNNINCDLMYGLPGQNLESWQRSLSGLISWAQRFQEIKHISAYALELAHNSPLLNRYPLDSRAYPQEDEFVEMYHALINTLSQADFQQYEISNFAKQGFQSRHNLNYWNNCQYLAFGVGAHRYINGMRSANFRQLRRYMEDNLGNETFEQIDGQIAVREAIMLGLRKMEGIDIESFALNYGINILERFDKQIAKLDSGGFIVLSDGKLKLSSKGVPVSNSVISEFI
jgi:oxygen-independent coproporphyrinogen-3 oxidase